MKQIHTGTENNGWDRKKFQGGANTDADAQDVARSRGTYLNAHNFRIADHDGGNGALTKVGGEVLFEGAGQPGAETYRCIGSISVSGRRFTAWASTAPGLFPPIIKVDGLTVAMSPDIPYVWDKKLQLDCAEDCEGGIVFDARSGDVPIHWPIKAMLDGLAAGELTYFDLFDVSIVQASPTRPLNRPRFRGFQTVGAGAGVVGGQRIYRVRYVNENGDRTPNGPPLGPVMVPFVMNSGGQTPIAPSFPAAGFAGMSVDQIGLRTRFAVKLRVRVDNRANFGSFEVVCEHFSTNAGPDAVPEITIVHRQQIQPGENDWYDVLDDGTVIDEIPTDENSIQMYYIREANSVRYINYRVVYGGVVIGRRSVEGEYIESDGTRLVPFTKNLGVKGHQDPINHCYFRRFQSGERHAIGVVYYDSTGGESYVDRVEESFRFPNRRDEKSGDSLAFSDAPCYAANVNGEVTPTYEVFDLDNATGRTQDGQVVNVMAEARRKIGAQNFQNQAFTSSYAGPLENFVPYGQNNDGTYQDSAAWGPWLKSSQLKPLRPVNPDDYKFGLDYRVNTRVAREGEANGNTVLNYNPRVFNVENHTMGVALRGVASQPAGMQGFSVVASKPAGRVIGQVLCKWKLISGPVTDGTFLATGSQATKDVWQFHVCFPDFNAGSINQGVWEGLMANDQRYGLQLVSPLGIASEMFGSANMLRTIEQEQGSYATIADMLSYVRVLWDNGQINPGNGSGGISPSAPLPGGQDHFAGFASWRNGAPASMPWGGPADQVLQITNAEEVVHQSGIRSMVFTMGSPVYSTTSAGGSKDFASPSTQAFHEPWYVANIVQDAIEPEDNEGYISLNHYQSFRSCIGIGDGTDGQTFEIVDENVDDFYDAAGGERFIWILTTQGVRAFMSADNLTAAEVNLLVMQIADAGSVTTAGGQEIYGLYRVEFGNDGDSRIILYNFTAEVGARVEVRYRGAEVRVYGDMITSPAMATLHDAAVAANPTNPISNATVDSGPVAMPRYGPNWFTGNGNALHTNGLPIPFANFHYNGRYMVPFGLGWGAGGPTQSLAISQLESGTLISVRQWKAIFDCEVRSPLYLSHFEAGGVSCYPQKQYVPRPFNFIFSGNTSADHTVNGLFGNYQDSNLYPHSNSNDWMFGGFLQSRQEVMPNYSIQPRVAFFRLDDFARIENERQCSMLVWSNKYTPLSSDTAGLKTFPVNNSIFVENSRGGIQRLFSRMGNLYVVTNGATFRALIESSIAYSADGTAFSMFAQDNFIGTVKPISETVGMPNDSWMTAAEGGLEFERVVQDVLTWFDGRTQHMLVGDQVMDIGIGVFRKALRAAVSTSPSRQVCAAIDQNKQELHLNMGAGTLLRSKSWTGTTDYRYDEMLYHDGRMYGMRGLQTYLMDVGATLNGSVVEAWVKVPSAPFDGERMEWVRVKVNSVRKPTRIEFFDEDDQLVSWMDAATFGQWWIKRETDWEQYVPRTNPAVNANRRRLQGRLAYYKVIFGEQGEDMVSSTSVQVKPMK